MISSKKIEFVFRSLSAQEEICIQIYVNYLNYERIEQIIQIIFVIVQLVRSLRLY
jgi:hypothetical protein